MDWDRVGVDLETLRALEDQLSLDEVFAVLSDAHARYVLYDLSRESSVTLDGLADFVTGFEAAVGGTVATPADRDRVRTRLHHVALPKLDDADYVDYDPDDGTVTRTNVPSIVDSLLGIDD